MSVLIGLFSFSSDGETRIYEKTDLSAFSFFSRSSIRECMYFFTKLMIKQTLEQQSDPNRLQFQSTKINNSTFVYHIMNTPQSINVAITEESYPARVVFHLLNQPPTDELFKLYQNPCEVDKLVKIQSQLDDVKKMVVQNINDVRIRGQHLDDLVKVTNELSNVSKQFYRQAKKTNSCCRI